MTTERFVVLGLAHVRSAWFTEIARWSTTGSVPVEFVKCLSTEELSARVASGRPFSAALLDGRLHTVDRDLIATLSRAGVTSLVVPDESASTDWIRLGAADLIDLPLDRVALVDALETHASPVDSMTGEVPVTRSAAVPTAWMGPMVAVTGTSGGGASTVAAALAQGLSADARHARQVVLADLARTAHQALLHDARDVVPGVQELVEAHRNGRPTTQQVSDLLYDVPSRGYRLLLGLRRPSDWVAIRSQAFTAALSSLRTAARMVIADVDADLEGEHETGSMDVEDRNFMARHVTREADLVVAVGTPDLTGIHGLVGALGSLRSHGIEGHRLLAVVNRAPRSPRSRSELTRALTELTGGVDQPDPHLGPLYLPERRSVDAIHRDLARFPNVLAGPLAAGVTAALAHTGRRDTRLDEPEAITPGSLGTWGEVEATS
ncbi:MAG: hypothetical protein KDB09_02320 [Acidimicrobiales bacterium]|nr:hypothetical protein [Acidimicrobiales bacterium]